MSTKKAYIPLDDVKIEVDGIDFQGRPKPGKYITDGSMTCYVNFQTPDGKTERSFEVPDHKARESLFLLWAVNGMNDLQVHINNQTINTEVTVFNEKTPVVLLKSQQKLASVIGFQAFLEFCSVESLIFKNLYNTKDRSKNSPELKKRIRDEKWLLQIELVKTFTPEVLYKFLCTSAFILAPNAVKIGAKVFKDRTPTSDILKMNTDPEVMKRLIGEDTVGPLQSLSAVSAVSSVGAAAEDINRKSRVERREKQYIIDKARHDLISGDLDLDLYKDRMDKLVRDAQYSLDHAEEHYAKRTKDLEWNKKYNTTTDSIKLHDKQVANLESELAMARQNLVQVRAEREKGIEERKHNLQRFIDIEHANRM